MVGVYKAKGFMAAIAFNIIKINGLYNMIKLQENSLRPVKDSIMPALEFSVVGQKANNQILINSTGNVFTENNKYISALDRVNNIWPDDFRVSVPRLANNPYDNTQSEGFSFRKERGFLREPDEMSVGGKMPQALSPPLILL